MTESNPKLKRAASGVMLLAGAFLLTFPLAQRATADTKLATSVMASSGGKATSTNFVMKSTLGQSTPIGPSASTNFGVGAGFWYQDPVAPAAIADLKAILFDRSVNDIYLEWSHTGDNVAIDHYVVYRNTQAYSDFTDSIGVTKGNSYLDPGAAKDTTTNYFYVVKAADPSRNLAEDSNRVGEFDRYLINAPLVK